MHSSVAVTKYINQSREELLELRRFPTHKHQHHRKHETFTCQPNVEPLVEYGDTRTVQDSDQKRPGPSSRSCRYRPSASTRKDIGQDTRAYSEPGTLTPRGRASLVVKLWIHCIGSLYNLSISRCIITVQRSANTYF